MPQVNKQSPVPAKKLPPKPLPAPADNGDAEELSGLKVSLYGRSKSGKTRLSATFPKPMLIIGAEDGTRSIATSRVKIDELDDDSPVWQLNLQGKDTGIRFVRCLTATTMDSAVRYLREHTEYKTTKLDTGSSLQDLIIKEFLGLDQTVVQRTFGLLDRQGWMQIGQQVKERLRSLVELADTQGLNVIIVAQERNFTDEGTGSDLLMPSVGSALTPSAAAWLNAASDYICQTFIRQQMHETPVPGTDTKVQSPTGKSEYCLRVGSHPVYQTGFRLPPGAVLPDVIVDPTYAKLAKLIRGEG